MMEKPFNEKRHIVAFAIACILLMAGIILLFWGAFEQDVWKLTAAIVVSILAWLLADKMQKELKN